MSARYFLDTNILAYCFDARHPGKHARANHLVREGIELRTAIISYQVVQEFISVALRKFHPVLQISDLQQYATVVLRPMLGVPSSMILYHRALELFDRYRFHWYDSLILAAAVEAQCDVLSSEDFRHKQRIEGVEIINPFL